MYTNENQVFVSLNDDGVTAGVNYRKELMELWLYLIPEKFQHIQIHTRLGPIKGRKAFVGQKKDLVYQFLNIPFAKPPVGQMRFKEPIAYGKWNGTLDATSYGPACFQNANYTITIWYGTSEDCLQLNIYVPFTISTAAPKSVMVWIHGGGYIYGTASFYDGSMIAAVGDVIVVTINYRLGIFGFLTLDEHGAKGNYGLLDQIQALKWIKDNIADYGGNPNDITIFGESAGGFSVGVLTLIPQNKGLFHRAIQESGAADSKLTIAKPRKFSLETAKELGCLNSSTSLLHCLREISALDLLTKSASVGTKLCNSGDLYCSQYGPVVDGEIIPRMPAQLLLDKTSAAFKFFKSLDIMIGNCVTEGSIFLAVLESDPQFQKHYNISAGIPRKYLCDTMSPNIAEHYFHNSTGVSTAICKEYGVKNNITLQSREILNVFGDLFFISPSVASLNAHINPESSTYQFMYTQVLSFVVGPKKPPWYIGPDHADELYYLFTMEYFNKILPNVTITQSDRLLAYQMRKYWTNFAKTG
jgi:carboxylesterase type B